MLTGFHERGGESKLICRTPEKASIELTYKGKTETFTLTWEDAQKEPFVYSAKYKESEIIEMLAADKKPLLKPKYATPRSRQTMLWARVVSDGIRATCPEVNYGTYTAEEISDIVDSESTAEQPVSELPIPNTVPAPARTANEAMANRKKKTVEPAKEDNAASQPEVEPAAEPTEVATVAEPTEQQVESVTSVSLDEPITSAQYDKILDLLAQIKASGVEDIKERIVEKLQKSGLKTLKELTVAEGDLVIGVLAEKNLEAWADLQLRGRTDSEIPF